MTFAPRDTHRQNPFGLTVDRDLADCRALASATERLEFGFAVVDGIFDKRTGILERLASRTPNEGNTAGEIFLLPTEPYFEQAVVRCEYVRDGSKQFRGERAPYSAEHQFLPIYPNYARAVSLVTSPVIATESPLHECCLLGGVSGNGTLLVVQPFGSEQHGVMAAMKLFDGYGIAREGVVAAVSNASAPGRADNPRLNSARNFLDLGLQSSNVIEFQGDRGRYAHVHILDGEFRVYSLTGSGWNRSVTPDRVDVRQLQLRGH